MNNNETFYVNIEHDEHAIYVSDKEGIDETYSFSKRVHANKAAEDLAKKLEYKALM